MTALAMILAAAERYADRVAIEQADGTQVTYRELVERARSHASGKQRGDLVEVVAERSADCVAACLGAWLAGAAWIPIDPTEPAARREAIRQRAVAVRPSTSSNSLAYVIATSGSTGTPKLVMVTHRGLPALVRAQAAAFELGPDARALWLHAPVFDASISDWATALASGATLVVPSGLGGSQLCRELECRAITHVDLPPVLLAYLDPVPAGLRVVVLGGEPCPVERVRTLARRVRVVVVYGPTEATVCSSLVVVNADRWRRPLIGEPLPGVDYRVIDGELWIGGDCLALGYAGDPDETARCFVVTDGKRMYRTGDRVEPVEGGLAFLGRGDRQRKLAGRRIELGEVEAAIWRAARGTAGAEGLRSVTTCIRPITPAGRDRLIGFIEADPGFAVAALQRALRTELPAWMVPTRIVVGPLPRTATGKLDHAALATTQLAVGAVPTGDAVAAELAALWCEVLGVESAIAGERFRDAGGDSLAAMTLHAAAAARALPLEPAVLATDPTFAELVQHVSAAAPAVGVTVAECEARGHESRRRISGGTLNLASAIRPRHDAVLVTGATGMLGRALLRAWRQRDDRRVIALVRAADHAEALRRVEPGIEVLCGDVALPKLGLSHEQWCELVETIASVVHAAATIDLAAGWDVHAPANVDGTAEIAKLVAAGRATTWHHISTLSVFVGTDRGRGRHDEHSDPDPAALAFGGYAQSKLAAEAIARRHQRITGRVTTIFRLGLLTSDHRRTRDQLGMTIRGLAKLGVAPSGGDALRFDVTPVDHAAAAIAALALRAERAGQGDVHHIASARGASFTELVAALRSVGVALVELTAAEWAGRARARIADPEIAMAYLTLCRLHGGRSPRFAPFDLFLATDADFATQRSVALLETLGVTSPAIDAASLATLVTGALAEPG